MAETLKLETPSVGSWAPAVVLAWLIPGGGHFLLKRPGRGAVLGVITKRTDRERLRYAAQCFAYFLAAIFGLSWLMYLGHG